MHISRLQSVLNAAVRLIFAARTSDLITPLLEELHWLKVSERIRFRLCILAYRCLNVTAPAFLADSLRLATMVEGRRCLRSSDTMKLLVPATCCKTLCIFPVTAAHAWNALPSSITLASSLFVSPDTLKLNCFAIHTLRNTFMVGRSVGNCISLIV